MSSGSVDRYQTRFQRSSPMTLPPVVSDVKRKSNVRELTEDRSTKTGGELNCNWLSTITTPERDSSKKEVSCLPLRISEIIHHLSKQNIYTGLKFIQNFMYNLVNFNNISMDTLRKINTSVFLLYSNPHQIKPWRNALGVPN